MVQTTGAGSKFRELDIFLDQLYTRWSRDACSAFCALEPGANNSAARAIFDEELAVLREIPRAVEHAFRTLSAHVGSQRNKYCEINALPSEILREIFLSTCENGLRWKDLASIIKTCKRCSLLAQSKLDTDYLTVIFQDSPRLEHVELTTGGDEVDQASRNGSTFVRQHDTQSRYTMRHLHTLRIHLPAFNLIHILHTIEITDRIKTVDLHCHDSSDEDHRQDLSADILPGIFAKLHTLSLGWQALDPVTGMRRGISGSGSFGDHEYSFIYTSFNWYDLPIVEDKFGPLLALKRIILCPTWIRPRLTEFLAVAPFVDELHILEGFSSVKSLQRLSSNPRNHLHLARVSHWAFISEENTSLWFFRSDIDLLKAFFQLLPSSRTRRTLSIAGFVKFEYPDGLQAAREFVVDLARVNVAITGPTKFDVGWDDHDQYDKVNWVYIRTYMSAESLWPDSEVPDVVREVMKE